MIVPESAAAIEMDSAAVSEYNVVTTAYPVSSVCDCSSGAGAVAVDPRPFIRLKEEEMQWQAS